MNWSVHDATAHFMSLIHEAFSARWALKIPGFKNVAQIFYSYRYLSEGIEGSLQRAFGKEPLYGQGRNATADLVKVGVVAATMSNKKPYLLANYSRNPTKRKSVVDMMDLLPILTIFKDDYLQRAEDPVDDILTWEAYVAISLQNSSR